jgi:hypothetical protein
MAKGTRREAPALNSHARERVVTDDNRNRGLKGRHILTEPFITPSLLTRGYVSSVRPRETPSIRHTQSDTLAPIGIGKTFQSNDDGTIRFKRLGACPADGPADSSFRFHFGAKGDLASLEAGREHE